MKNFIFPRSRIILPEFRSSLAKKTQEPVSCPGDAPESDRAAEMQRLLENSLFCGTVICLVTREQGRAGSTTGIVKAIDPTSRNITVETLEGPRPVRVRTIFDIREI